MAVLIDVPFFLHFIRYFVQEVDIYRIDSYIFTKEFVFRHMALRQWDLGYLVGLLLCIVMIWVSIFKFFYHELFISNFVSA